VNAILQRQRNLRAFFTHVLIAKRMPYTVENLNLLLANYLALDELDPEMTVRLLNSLPESTFPPIALLPPSTNSKQERN
jgi:hypothetical protein